MKKSSSEQQSRIRKQFDSFCKTLLKNEMIDYERERNYRLKYEISFSELTQKELRQLEIMDDYIVESEMFHVFDYDIEVKDELIGEALKSLPEKKRNVILLSFFLDMTDTEIAKYMNLVRSTIHHHRTSSLTVIDICKPYKNKILADRIRKINDSISDINFVPFYSGEKVTAMLWYAETNFLGTVLDKDIKGIRIRQGNILIGDENTLRKCYKEERFNSWMVGELLVFNEDIIPNTRRDDYEKNSAYKELLSQFTEWANEMSRQIRHRSYERSLTQSDKKFLSDESVTDVDGVDISLGTELDSYDMDDSDSVANTDLLSKLSLLMDMGKKKTKYNVLNLNSKFTVDQKQTLEHVFDALYAKYTNAKANDIIQTIIDSF